MIRNLVTITPEQIEESTSKCIEERNFLITYLQDSGNKSHKWNEKDINVWLYDDIDE